VLYRVLADIIVLIHLAFIIFVIFGGFLVLRWRWLFWFHIPAAIWGALIEFVGWICPLTPLENQFRMKSGEVGYQNGFIEHYIIPLIYPDELTRSLQITLGIFVIIINIIIYSLIFSRKLKKGNK
jgi:hypothetical protein